MPLGRAWAPTDTFRLVGHTFLAPLVLELDARGAPLLVAEAVGGIGQDAYGLTWSDSTWLSLWNLGYATNPVRHGDAPLDRHPLVWQSVDPKGPNGNLARLEVAEMFEGHLGPVDTIAVVQGTSFMYATASHGDHRWVAKTDFGDLRLWRSSTPRMWEELPIPGVAGNGVTLGAIDDTTALVVFAWSREGIRWGYMRGATWDEQPPLISSSVFRGGGLRLRRNAERDYWLGWASDDMWYNVARFANDAWGPITQIDCNYRLPHFYLAKSSALSRDPSPYPAIAWSAYSTSTGVETVCACVPTDSGFTVADNLENSENGLIPVIVRDLNGDVWVAWWRYFDGMFFTHTYTVATSSAPVVAAAGDARTITWTLSEPAPETWWAVLQAEPGGAFEPVARVRAGASLELSWTDELVTAGPLRYRIRRESVDTRYEWLSDEVVWDGATAVELALLSAEATPNGVTLTWQGEGAGTIEAFIERRTESTDWQVLGVAQPESADRLQFEDSTAAPGTRYAYRLAYTENGEARHTMESWLDVPERPVLALEGFQPNPARAVATVAFTLPSAGRGTLEVLDVSGRRVFRARLDGLGAGRHTLSVDAARELAPGVYIIRLAFEGRRITSRGVIVH